DQLQPAVAGITAQNLVQKFDMARRVLGLAKADDDAARESFVELADGNQLVNDEIRLFAAGAFIDDSSGDENGIGLDQVREFGEVLRPEDGADHSAGVLEVEHGVFRVRLARAGVLRVRKLDGRKHAP